MSVSSWHEESSPQDDSHSFAEIEPAELEGRPAHIPTEPDAEFDDDEERIHEVIPTSNYGGRII